MEEFWHPTPADGRIEGLTALLVGAWTRHVGAPPSVQAGEGGGGAALATAALFLSQALKGGRKGAGLTIRWLGQGTAWGEGTYDL